MFEYVVLKFPAVDAGSFDHVLNEYGKAGYAMVNSVVTTFDEGQNQELVYTLCRFTQKAG